MLSLGYTTTTGCCRWCRGLQGGHEVHHADLCRLRRCRFYGLGEHAYKSDECLYWCQSDTCTRPHPHRFRYQYCVLCEAWDPLL